MRFKNHTRENMDTVTVLSKMLTNWISNSILSGFKTCGIYSFDKFEALKRLSNYKEESRSSNGSGYYYLSERN